MACEIDGRVVVLSIAVCMRLPGSGKVKLTLLGANKRKVSSTQISPLFADKVDDRPVLTDGPVKAIICLLVLIEKSNAAFKGLHLVLCNRIKASRGIWDQCPGSRGWGRVWREA